ncbi:MAG: hypothetical protein II852_10630 [Bacteroidales bacterium]|nr:hypothetical protein [Bacteroidales bacterium]
MKKKLLTIVSAAIIFGLSACNKDSEYVDQGTYYEYHIVNHIDSAVHIITYQPVSSYDTKQSYTVMPNDSISIGMRCNTFNSLYFDLDSITVFYGEQKFKTFTKADQFEENPLNPDLYIQTKHPSWDDMIYCTLELTTIPETNNK